MTGLDTIDRYTMKARLYPAVIALAPAIGLVITCISWDSLSLSDAVAAVGLLAAITFLSDIARRRGKKIERTLFRQWGGLPSVHMLRLRDETFDNKSKNRYIKLLADKIEENPPSEEDERKAPERCDEFYGRCCNWLRENTRDKDKFNLLFEENMNYGFRRNLLGLKSIALLLDAAIAIALIFTALVDFQPNLIGANVSEVLAVALACGVHGAIFILCVTEEAAHEAARQYARQLILVCEALIEEAAPLRGISID